MLEITVTCRLEDPDSRETKEFVEKQKKLTDCVLKTCETREKLREKVTELYDFPKYETPFRAGAKYFYFHNSGLQPQRVLYIQASSSIPSIFISYFLLIFTSILFISCDYKASKRRKLKKQNLCGM